MISRRAFALAAVSGILGASALGAQEFAKVQRVGVLSPFARSANWDVLVDALRELGWSDGRNIAFQYRFADGISTRLPEFAADLVRLKVDIIVTGLGATGVALQATSRIPIVMTFGITDVEQGSLTALRGLAAPLPD